MYRRNTNNLSTPDYNHETLKEDDPHAVNSLSIIYNMMNGNSTSHLKPTAVVLQLTSKPQHRSPQKPQRQGAAHLKTSSHSAIVADQTI